ncbi:MAG: DNA repair protein RadC [Patescibacteria group bacterium]
MKATHARVHYRMKSGTLTLDNPERRYILKVRDMPLDEKPRERLLAHGPSALSIQELLAVILSTGTKKEEVMAMATRIMKEYGEKSLMSQKSAKELASNLDIPLGKALQIIATAELGRRFFSKNEHASPTLRTAREVFGYTQDMRTLSKEHLRGIYLNSHYKVIHDEVVSIGTLDSNIIHPRDIFRPALEYSAAALILVHNHPSGIATPSDADVSVTEQIIKAGALLGIDLIDHIIVTKDGFKSVPAHYK